MIEQSYADQIKPLTQFDTPDTQIPIYTGIFFLRNKENYIEVKGELTFKWFPYYGVAFKGNTSGLKYDSPNFDLEIEGQVVGECILTTFNSSGECNITGLLKSNCTIGDKTVSTHSINFELCNFRNFEGRFVRNGNGGHSSNSLQLYDEQFEIDIHKHENYQDKKRLLNLGGAYQTLYSGKLEYKNKKKNGLSIKETEVVFADLFLFLSFLNGRMTSPIFIKGVFEKEIIWSDYTAYHIDVYKHATSWSPQIFDVELENLWRSFRIKMKDNSYRDCITTIIHSYLRANNQVIFLNEGISTIANTLELLFNFIIVENKKIIIGRDVENLQASNKIRLLLSQIMIDNEIPENLKRVVGLKSTISDLSINSGAPELFTYVRNSIVHGQQEKRKRLSDIDNYTLDELLTLGIWYIELLLLYILEYKGVYMNRTLKREWYGEGEEKVPWLR